MKRSTRPTLAGNIVLYVVLILLIGTVIGLVGVGLKRRHDRLHQATVSTLQTSSTLAQSSSTPASSSDTQSLSSDLSSVNSSLSQGDQNLSTTSGAVGDQQQQIAVPTN